MSNDSIVKTFLVAFLLCAVCSVLVCLAAIVRIDREAYNKQLEVRKTVLAAAGFSEEMKGGNIDELFANNFEPRVVDVASGNYTDAVDVATYDDREALDMADMVIKAPEGNEAGIANQVKYAKVYLTKDGGVVLPIRGAGMWGPMLGYIAVAADGSTVKGLTFFQHAETPGLGAEIDNPRWKAQWPGKQIFDNSGAVAIKVVKNGKYDPNAADAATTIDGLAGATVTGSKVQGVVRYWFSDSGFGKYLANLKAKRG
ncbi:Na(+)-translocating NADH-quinone reductase subunit C [Desulfuromonas thiophila]|uniref:Na(+)-translocating NADH-quinone reductase subunit C n=1 Tax=Desulfuromonas thiophila TaxID=57664 RepID=A0A1G6X9S1_9BACT|nr:Na(+)-translocating NADH-quinone reductase subunit C [Desulfuromonas thiophila]SDD74838.1 Na+-transporting NADH:ubiquinone oxidoreductase subunit C [Desulfuromonas thiophila]